MIRRSARSGNSPRCRTARLALSKAGLNRRRQRALSIRYDPPRAPSWRPGGDRLREHPILWEPACGDGAVTRRDRPLRATPITGRRHPRAALALRVRTLTVRRLRRAPAAQAIVTQPCPQPGSSWRDGRRPTGVWQHAMLETLDIEVHGAAAQLGLARGQRPQPAAALDGRSRRAYLCPLEDRLHRRGFPADAQLHPGAVWDCARRDSH